jgi:hypothetical protein
MARVIKITPCDEPVDRDAVAVHRDADDLQARVRRHGPDAASDLDLIDRTGAD